LKQREWNRRRSVIASNQVGTTPTHLVIRLMLPTKQTKSEESPELFFLVYDSECPICSRFIQLLDKLYTSSSHQLTVAPSVYSLSICKGFKNIKLGQDQIDHLASLQSSTIIFIDSRSRVHLYSRAILAAIMLSNQRAYSLFYQLCLLLPLRLTDKLYKEFSSRRLLISEAIKVKKKCLLGCQSVILIDRDGHLLRQSASRDSQEDL